MSKNKIVITEYKEKKLMSIFEDDRLSRFFFDEESSIVGNIYVGKVKNIVKNINAAFVEIGENMLAYFSMKDETPIFLNKKNNNKLVCGDELLVQVVKDGIKTKAPQVSSKLTFPGKYMVLNLEAGTIGISKKIRDEGKRNSLKKLISGKLNKAFGAIIRTSAVDADAISIEAELHMLQEEFGAVVDNAVYRKPGQCLFHVPNSFLQQINHYLGPDLEQIITDQPQVYHQLKEYFEMYDEESKKKLSLYQEEVPLSSAYNINHTLERALNKRVWLKSGAYLVIEQTEAMVVIDVNTGKSIGRQDMEEHFYKINLEAARECAYQIKLRNLSGIIIIDFINMESSEHRASLITRLKEEISGDPVKTNYIDTTKLGLVELTRKKVTKSLSEFFC